MKIELTTAIFGGIDRLKNIPIQNISFQHNHYCEANLPVSMHCFPPNNRNLALYYKTQQHKFSDAKVFIWVDGKIQILSDNFVSSCIEQLGSNQIGILKHAERSCIYEEIDYIEAKIKDGNEYLTTRYAHRPIREQVEWYRKAGYPARRGLNDCCIIVRRNDHLINKVCDNWWVDCNELNYFDQTSIQFWTWATGINIIPLEFPSGYFKHVKHRKVC